MTAFVMLPSQQTSLHRKIYFSFRELGIEGELHQFVKLSRPYARAIDVCETMHRVLGKNVSSIQKAAAALVVNVIISSSQWPRCCSNGGDAESPQYHNGKREAKNWHKTLASKNLERSICQQTKQVERHAQLISNGKFSATDAHQCAHTPPLETGLQGNENSDAT